jgi:hypothetical protein
MRVVGPLLEGRAAPRELGTVFVHAWVQAGVLDSDHRLAHRRPAGPGAVARPVERDWHPGAGLAAPARAGWPTSYS